MFQFLRRVSGSLLPRPDRPWRDDATSHAPTIGRKRRRSLTEQDHGDSASSTTKRTKTDFVTPDTECDSASGGESPRGDAVPPVEGQDVKEVTKGVNEVDLEDKDKLEDASIRPEGVPLPDSPSGSPEPESESPETEPDKSDVVEETKDQEHADDEESATSSASEDDAGEGAEAEPVTTNTDTSVDEIAPAQEVTIAVESGLHDTPETLEVKA